METSPLSGNSKRLHLNTAVQRREALRLAGKTLVLTNGCFDLLHPGHLFFLQCAAHLGDELWVALNSEKSIKNLKGPTRPILNDCERSYALGMLPFINGIILFDTPRLTLEISLLKPDVYAKAGDYDINSLNPEERDALQAVGAKIQFLPFLKGYSTTQLIEKIHRAAQQSGSHEMF